MTDEIIEETVTNVDEFTVKGDEVKALYEIVNDYTEMAKHSYAMAMMQLKQGEEIIKTGKLPDGKPVEDMKEIAEAMENIKNDAAKIDVAISRADAILSRIMDILGITTEDEETDNEGTESTEDDDTTDTESDTEVSETA